MRPEHRRIRAPSLVGYHAFFHGQARISQLGNQTLRGHFSHSEFVIAAGGEPPREGIGMIFQPGGNFADALPRGFGNMSCVIARLGCRCDRDTSLLSGVADGDHYLPLAILGKRFRKKRKKLEKVK